jgi:cation diffusion facilitator family transporter
VETLLLLITCVWIIYEAIQRLFFKHVKVEASIWAFIIMVVSILVDMTRSRILKRAADKYKSQALEADALHFSTDIWSSSVVIVGLIGVKLSQIFPGLRFLLAADAVAALGVSVIVIYVSLQLGKRRIDALLDTAPRGLISRITHAVEVLDGVEEVHKVRLLPSGANMFIDAHVVVKGSYSLNEVHDLMDRIEDTVHEIVPDADVTIHPEPFPQ